MNAAHLRRDPTDVQYWTKRLRRGKAASSRTAMRKAMQITFRQALMLHTLYGIAAILMAMNGPTIVGS